MRRKVIGNYARNLYFPLMRMKRATVDMFNQRSDFEQVICSEDLTNKSLKESLEKLLFEELDNQIDSRFEQDCINKIKTANMKIFEMQDYALLIRLRLENALQFLQKRYLSHISGIQTKSSK